MTWPYSWVSVVRSRFSRCGSCSRAAIFTFGFFFGKKSVSPSMPSSSSQQLSRSSTSFSISTVRSAVLTGKVTLPWRSRRKLQIASSQICSSSLSG